MILSTFPECNTYECTQEGVSLTHVILHVFLNIFKRRIFCVIEVFIKYTKKYTVSQEFPDSVKNMLLLKNLQFWPDHYEILSKWGPHEYLLLSKFRNDRVKIVDFLVKANFWPSPETTVTQCIYVHMCIDT